MSTHNPKPKRFVLGICIVIIGALALLDKLNIFEVRNLFQFWPTIFIAVGLLKILHSKSRTNIFIGAGLITLGVIMTLNHLDIIHVHIRDWWPVIIIAVGLFFIFRTQHLDPASKETIFGDAESGNSTTLDITAIMSGNKTVNNTQDFKGGEITAIMGGVELDLRDASIQSDAILNVWATWGGIVIKVPRDWLIVNRVTAIMGGAEDKCFPATASNKRLIITGTAIMGGIEIKN
jgi:predicted membrane protein